MRFNTTITVSEESARKMQNIRSKYPKSSVSRLFEQWVMEFDLGDAGGKVEQ